MKSFGALIEDYNKRLVELDDKHTSEKPAPNKWSKKEILGHLVDSAINNYRRFVVAQKGDDMILTGYDQDFWVSAQNYQAISYWEIVELWFRLNQQIARLIEQTSVQVMDREYPKHNLDVICFNKLNRSKPASLRYLFEDYVAHMEHHLRQILG